MAHSAEQINFLLLFLTGTLGLLFLSAMLILFVFIYKKRILNQKNKIQELKTSYQQELLSATIEAQEKERKRIAKDLHDEVGALLSLARLNASRAYENTKSQVFRHITAETISIVDDTINNVRRISKDLLPSTLEEFGLMEAMRELCQKINNSSASLNVKFYFIGDDKKLASEIELALYRVSQELINNALKHSSANEITVHLNMTSEKVLLKVHDNGVGFELRHMEEKEVFQKGIGLKNIQSRLSMLDGKINFRITEPQGTAALVELNI